MSTLAAQPVTLQQTESMYKQLQTMGTHKQIESAKNVYVYLNGDKHFPGRKFVVNKRHIGNFDGFLNQVTVGIKAPFGAVRNIYTPNAGHRVQQLEQLANGMDLVAGGQERFRKLSYKEISIKRRQPQKPTKQPLRSYRTTNRMNVEARWRKYVKEPCQIFVYGNGNTIHEAQRLLLIPRVMKKWDLVLQEITEKVSMRTGQAVRKLYDMNYKLLADPSELENGRYYIAVGSERLKRGNYGEINKFARTTKHVSPRRPNQPLPPLRKTRKPKTQPADGDKAGTSYTKMYARKKKQMTVMGASAATGGRPLVIEEPGTSATDSVFHAKPVKVKRAAKPSADSVPPPADSTNNVFLSNTQQEVAEEVAEDEDTKVDLPVDQVPAETVEEELPAVAESPAPVAASPEPTPAPAEDVPVATPAVEATPVPPPQPAAAPSPAPPAAAPSPAPEKAVIHKPKRSEMSPKARPTKKKVARQQPKRKAKTRIES